MTLCAIPDFCAQSGHTHAISTVAVNASETLVADGGMDGIIRLWAIGNMSGVARKIAKAAAESKARERKSFSMRSGQVALRAAKDRGETVFRLFMLAIMLLMSTINLS